MSTSIRKHKAALISAATGEGLVVVELIQSHNKLKLVVKNGCGDSRKIFAALTPSDHRAMANHKSTCRRIARELLGQ